jgi:hypothetical protein
MDMKLVTLVWIAVCATLLATLLQGPTGGLVVLVVSAWLILRDDAWKK